MTRRKWWAWVWWAHLFKHSVRYLWSVEGKKISWVKNWCKTDINISIVQYISKKAPPRGHRWMMVVFHHSSMRWRSRIFKWAKRWLKSLKQSIKRKAVLPNQCRIWKMITKKWVERLSKNTSTINKIKPFLAVWYQLYQIHLKHNTVLRPKLKKQKPNWKNTIYSNKVKVNTYQANNITKWMNSKKKPILLCTN